MNNPRVANDIGEYLLYSYNERPPVYAIGSISRDRFIQVGEDAKDSVMKAISLMNGEHTFQEIDCFLAEKFGVILNSEALYEKLIKADLIFEEGIKNAEKGEYDLLSIKILDVSLKKTKKFFSAISVFAIPLFFITAVMTVLTIIFAVINQPYVKITSILEFSESFFYNILYFFIIFTISVFVHELSHGMVASRYGLVPRKLTLYLYLYITPTVLINLPGLYTIKPRARVLVWSAGVVSNTFLACIGLIASIVLQKEGYSSAIIQFLNRFWYINVVFVIVNLCPLLPLDGYFILITILKSPNLRKNAFMAFVKSVRTRKFQLKFGQCMYFIFSVSIMGFLVLKEITVMIATFRNSLPNGIGTAFWNIKQYLVIIVLMLTRLIMKKYTSKKSICSEVSVKSEGGLK